MGDTISSAQQVNDHRRQRSNTFEPTKENAQNAAKRSNSGDDNKDSANYPTPVENRRLPRDD